MLASVTKTFSISYAHRLMNHSGKCSRIHGHTGKIEVTLWGEVNEDTGMVKDFGDFKPLIQKIEESFDHHTVLYFCDPIVLALEHIDPGDLGILLESITTIGCHPTAETLAEIVLTKAYAMWSTQGHARIRVRFWEGDESYAEVQNF